ncbi:toxin-activating lysine-acyltransferase [Cognatiyoonia sp. IB215182]|uniref:toxin-activating lysine-acyltransferase n=1 Tax=Cognatiyoonia sp. IB215182 TaxID=3097353 RepID=UPI002A143610|nr:toxin-activating lysine-acyltransferase [Cognatiyoonia sp. IB215182]MDX8355630.1 toxin-activating lysine-acyltransferase [Cognatiyoonia sp. IB215182]
MTDARNKTLQEKLDPETFASVMGQAVWLMSMSEAHRDLPIKSVEKLIAPALLLKQFKLYAQGKRPLAFLTWATVSDAVAKRFHDGDRQLELTDWRGGDNLIVVECVSPFQPKEEIERTFLKDFARALHDQKEN